MKNKTAFIITGVLLAIMFILTLFSSLGDSYTYDETAHIGAGYSYLTQQDYRLNPEHPPLIKDLAALPLLFLKLNFPRNDPSWTQENPPQWWFQFDFARQFLYKSGNNPDLIFLWTRFPMILVMLFLGFFIFWWTRKLFGNKAGVLTVFLYAFSPTIIAHGKLVTTDIGAALGAVLGTYFWIKFLEKPTLKNVALSGLAWGLVMMFKFSLVLLVPFFAILTIAYPLFKNRTLLLKYIGLAVLSGIIALIFISVIYQFHIWNFPKERQIRDTQYLMDTSSLPKSLISIEKWLSTQTVFRPMAQYLLGALLAINRSSTGNTTYFMGEVSANGWRSYFPIVYFLKYPLAFHILTLISLIYFFWLLNKHRLFKPFPIIKDFVLKFFTPLAMILWLAIYWFTSIRGALNIGIRHLMPIFPFTLMLIAWTVSSWLKPPRLKLKFTIVVLLLLWQAGATIYAFPNFLSYFNEAAGGGANGYKFAVDSNLDWGQDLKRLKNWTEEQDVPKIYIDYFGGADLDYYFGNKYEKWWGQRDPKELKNGDYLAVSATLLQGGRAKPVMGFDQPTNYYMWLNAYEPIAKIGNSIFVYQIK